MGAHRAIGERMRKAKSLAARRDVATDWWSNWYADHNATLARIERALGAGHVGEAGRYLGQLKALDEKALSAMPRVIDALTDNDVA